MIRTLRARIALLAGGLMMVAFVVLGLYLFFSLRFQLLRSLDDNLRLSAEQLLPTIEREDNRFVFAQGDFSGQSLRQQEDVIRLLSPDGQIWAQQGSIAIPSSLSMLQSEQEQYATWLIPDIAPQAENAQGNHQQNAGESVRVFTLPVRVQGQTVAFLQVARSLESIDEALQTLLILLLIGAPFIVGAAVGGGYWLAGRTLKPIDVIRQKAAEISAHDLSQRLKLDLPDDEVGRLAQTFDDMLARLEDAFQRQRRFVSDASHELRTPLAIIRGEVEVALEQPRSAEAYVNILESVHSEVERLNRLTNDLLLLARSDNAQLFVRRQRIDLSELITTLIATLETRLHEAKMTVQLDLPPALWIDGDFDRLLQLFLNLIDNAILYAPGSRLAIGASVVEGAPVVVVADDGPGIPQEHLPHIFERFYRVDAARSNQPGNGLGLAIALEIARAHGGRLTVESEPNEGATFTLWLPGEPQAGSIPQSK